MGAFDPRRPPGLTAAVTEGLRERFARAQALDGLDPAVRTDEVHGLLDFRRRDTGRPSAPVTVSAAQPVRPAA
ncbi:hypothetical protein ACFFSW_37025 [Saccharothrix longispora]|uniref:Uncharacterized protein n=1 Tax=Saccharothrix longispora TaxID=33920 RepID=A0ABU1PPU2_9PSEU|nr:hypothetical protein [Saccharothrix longispora]MDR6592653.1 hypothetical protein [Saccharothrix longispora]